jgi:hypothetical protein
MYCSPLPCYLALLRQYIYIKRERANMSGMCIIYKYWYSYYYINNMFSLLCFQASFSISGKHGEQIRALRTVKLNIVKQTPQHFNMWLLHFAAWLYIRGKQNNRRSIATDTRMCNLAFSPPPPHTQ